MTTDEFQRYIERLRFIESAIDLAFGRGPVESHTPPMRWWWLSFAGDEGHRGCCIVQAQAELLALTSANFHGCNPGGEVMFMLIPDEHVEAEIARWGANRLFHPTGEHVRRLDGEVPR